MLVTLLVQGAKVLGMPARFAPWAALVTGMVVASAIGSSGGVAGGSAVGEVCAGRTDAVAGSYWGV